mgnify:CR=1 FL=1
MRPTYKPERKPERKPLEPLRDENGKPYAFDLHRPIRSYGEELTTLTFYREPNLDDFEHVERMGNIATLRYMLSKACGITESEAGKLHPVDFKRAGVIFSLLCGDNDSAEDDSTSEAGTAEASEDSEDA